ncbi:hypothetical protein V8C26DRAFT_410137 [Trichoderma gracile]
MDCHSLRFPLILLCLLIPPELATNGENEGRPLCLEETKLCQLATAGIKYMDVVVVVAVEEARNDLSVRDVDATTVVLSTGFSTPP